MAKYKLHDLLASWEHLNKHIAILTEGDCVELINMEKRGKHRVNVLLRIHSRFNKLRYTRERIELLTEHI